MQQRTSPAVGTVEDGYRYKGGDPASESSWEQVAPIDVSSSFGAGARQLPNGVVERVGPRGGVTRISTGAANGGDEPLVGADARARFMIGLGPLTAAQKDLGELERQGNPLNRDWGAALIDNMTENPFTRQIGDTAARVIGGEDYQKYQQASATYEASLLPIQSGAAVTPTEAQRQIRADLPALGDSPDVLARKARNREMRINAIARGIGKPDPFGPVETDPQTGLPRYDEIAAMTAGVREIPFGGGGKGGPGGGGSGPQPGDVRVQSQNLAAEDTPESLRAQGYVYDAARDTWSRTRQEEVGGVPSIGGPMLGMGQDPLKAREAFEQMPEWAQQANAGINAAIDGATFGIPRKLTAATQALGGRGGEGGFGDRYQRLLAASQGQARDGAREFPVTAGAAGIAGSLAAPGVGAAGRFIASAPKARFAASRGAATGGLFGAAYGAGQAAPGDELEGGAQGAAGGALAGGLLAGGLRAAPRAARGLFSGNSTRRADVQTLRDNGIFVPPGQAAGGFLQNLESVGARLPIAGPAIRGARERSVESLNRSVANRSLSNVGEGLPANVPVGAEAADFVKTRLGRQFDQAADMVPQVTVDEPFFQNLAGIAARKADLPESAQTQFDSILRDRLSRLNGPVSGRQLRQIESEIGEVADSMDDRQLSGMLMGVRDELQDLLGRANPEAGQMLQQARAGWADYTRMRAASAAANGNPFSPAQLQTAVRMQDGSVGKGSVATGDARLQDISRAASSVLKDSFGNPGTADVGGWLGMGGLAMANPPAAGMAAAGLGAVATPYMMMGRRIVESLPPNARPEQVQQAAAQLSQLAEGDPQVRQLLTQLLNTARQSFVPVTSGGAGAAYAQ